MGVGARLDRGDKIRVKNDILKAKGICTTCRKEKTTDNKTTCDKCLKKLKNKREKLKK